MAEPSLEQIRERLRQHGLRATPARVTVLRKFMALSAPLTHADLVEGLDGQGWDRATLYRNLADLTEAGLLKRVDMGDRLWRYEMLSEQENHPAEIHPHFLCTQCGEVSCLPEGAIRVHVDARLPRALQEGAVELQVRGRCDRCEAA
jgi:Fur family ferric uptake transcriptional regulator